MALARQTARLARRRPLATAALLACALAALAGGARWLAPADLALRRHFPRARAAHLAHLLADLSAHALAPPGSWRLEEEAGNYTTWRYVVSYACGPRCEGRAAVLARADAPPAHGLASAHTVRLQRRHCRRPPLLPWPLLCDETETESVITSTGAGQGEVQGARLELSVRARCGAAAALLARCAGAAELRAAADALLLRLADSLPAADRGSRVDRLAEDRSIHL